MKKVVKNRKYVVFLMLLLALAMGTAVVLAAAVTIDTFDVANQNVTASNLNPSVFAVGSDPSVLGTERDVQILWATGSGVSVQVNQGVPPTGALAFSQDNATSAEAWITWDGVDGSATIVPDGLCSVAGCASNSGIDLTGGGTNDAFHVEIPYDDLPFAIRLRVYSGNLAQYFQYTISLPGSIGTTGQSHVDFIVPFTSFSVIGSPSFTNVGAIEMYFDGRPVQSIGGDVSISFLDLDNFRDFGDAPISYGNPSHLPLGLRLGRSVDAEATSQFSLDATGDNILEADDEEGITRNFAQKWTPGANVSLTVLMAGCQVSTCYLNGWIDWDNDGSFDSPRDQVFTDYALGQFFNGFAFPHNITIPNDAPIATGSNTAFYARFRICSATGTCNNPITTNVSNGEVEDYYWGFTPTAVSLQSFTPAGNAALPVVALVGVLALAVISLGVVIVRREQKRA